jgi:hypothetical protein
MNRDPQLGAHRRLYHAQHGSLATHTHTFPERDLRGHQQRNFDRFADPEREIREEKRSLRTEVLRKSAGFMLGPGQPHRNRDVHIEALSTAAFQMVRGRSHGFLKGGAGSRPGATRTKQNFTSG